jgi:hypothetical protein
VSYNSKSFENLSIFIYFEKTAVAYYNAGVVVVNTEGLALVLMFVISNKRTRQIKK